MKQVNKIEAYFDKDGNSWQFVYYDVGGGSISTPWEVGGLHEESSPNEVEKEALYAARNWIRADVADGYVFSVVSG